MMPKDGHNGVCYFEGDLCTGNSKDSSEFLTEARNIGNKDKDVFIDFLTSIWMYDRSCRYLL